MLCNLSAVLFSMSRHFSARQEARRRRHLESDSSFTYCDFTDSQGSDDSHISALTDPSMGLWKADAQGRLSWDHTLYAGVDFADYIFQVFQSHLRVRVHQNRPEDADMIFVPRIDMSTKDGIGVFLHTKPGRFNFKVDPPDAEDKDRIKGTRLDNQRRFDDFVPLDQEGLPQFINADFYVEEDHKFELRRRFWEFSFVGKGFISGKINTPPDDEPFSHHASYGWYELVRNRRQLREPKDRYRGKWPFDRVIMRPQITQKRTMPVQYQCDMWLFFVSRVYTFYRNLRRQQVFCADFGWILRVTTSLYDSTERDRCKTIMGVGSDDAYAD